MNKKTILAIDVGTGMVKVFAGRLSQAEGGLEILGSGAAPTAGYDRGVITDINALAHSIRQAVDCVVMAAENRAADYVCLGIGGSTLITQNSTGSVALESVGITTPHDVSRACKAANFAVAHDDYEPLHILAVKESTPRQGEALEVEAHIVSAPKLMLQELTQALANKGITVNGIVSSSIVTAQVVNKELSKQVNNFIFMDIGAGTTDFVIYVNGNLSFSASIPLGGDYITNDLMQGLSVSRSHAEEIKRYYSRLSLSLRNQGIVLDCNDYGTTDKHISYDFLYDIIESRVDEIVTLVYDYVKPLVDKQLDGNGQPMECIYLTGGLSIMPSVAASITKAFQIPVETVSPVNVPVEYAHAANTVCYGLINHGARISVSELVKGQSAWNVIIHKAKRLLKM